jgi:hypothetical protein
MPALTMLLATSMLILLIKRFFLCSGLYQSAQDNLLTAPQLKVFQLYYIS